MEFRHSRPENAAAYAAQEWLRSRGLGQEVPAVRDGYPDVTRSHGFQLRGRVEQHPGYVGCLYQRAASPSVNREGEGNGLTP